MRGTGLATVKVLSLWLVPLWRVTSPSRTARLRYFNVCGTCERLLSQQHWGVIRCGLVIIALVIVPHRSFPRICLRSYVVHMSSNSTTIFHLNTVGHRPTFMLDSIPHPSGLPAEKSRANTICPSASCLLGLVFLS